MGPEMIASLDIIYTEAKTEDIIIIMPYKVKVHRAHRHHLPRTC